MKKDGIESVGGRKDFEWLKPLQNTQSSYSRHLYIWTMGRLASLFCENTLTFIGKNFIFDFDRIGKNTEQSSGPLISGKERMA